MIPTQTFRDAVDGVNLDEIDDRDDGGKVGMASQQQQVEPRQAASTSDFRWEKCHLHVRSMLACLVAQVLDPDADSFVLDLTHHCRYRTVQSKAFGLERTNAFRGLIRDTVPARRSEVSTIHAAKGGKKRRLRTFATTIYKLFSPSPAHTV